MVCIFGLALMMQCWSMSAAGSVPDGAYAPRTWRLSYDYEQCISRQGVCGICTPELGASIGSECTEDGDCSTKYCAITSLYIPGIGCHGICKERLIDGTLVAPDHYEACASQHGVCGVCGNRVKAGQACSSDEECATGACMGTNYFLGWLRHCDGVCREPFPDGQLFPKESWGFWDEKYCASGKRVCDMCGEKAPEMAACHEIDDCQPGLCCSAAHWQGKIDPDEMRKEEQPQCTGLIFQTCTAVEQTRPVWPDEAFNCAGGLRCVKRFSNGQCPSLFGQLTVKGKKMLKSLVDAVQHCFNDEGELGQVLKNAAPAWRCSPSLELQIFPISVNLKVICGPKAVRDRAVDQNAKDHHGDVAKVEHMKLAAGGDHQTDEVDVISYFSQGTSRPVQGECPARCSHEFVTCFHYYDRHHENDPYGVCREHLDVSQQYSMIDAGCYKGCADTSEMAELKSGRKSQARALLEDGGNGPCQDADTIDCSPEWVCSKPFWQKVLCPGTCGMCYSRQPLGKATVDAAVGRNLGSFLGHDLGLNGTFGDCTKDSSVCNGGAQLGFTANAEFEPIINFAGGLGAEGDANKITMDIDGTLRAAVGMVVEVEGKCQQAFYPVVTHTFTMPPMCFGIVCFQIIIKPKITIEVEGSLMAGIRAVYRTSMRVHGDVAIDIAEMMKKSYEDVLGASNADSSGKTGDIKVSDIKKRWVIQGKGEVYGMVKATVGPVVTFLFVPGIFVNMYPYVSGVADIYGTVSINKASGDEVHFVDILTWPEEFNCLDDDQNRSVMSRLGTGRGEETDVDASETNKEENGWCFALDLSLPYGVDVSIIGPPAQWAHGAVPVGGNVLAEAKNATAAICDSMLKTLQIMTEHGVKGVLCFLQLGLGGGPSFMHCMHGQQESGSFAKMLDCSLRVVIDSLQGKLSEFCANILNEMPISPDSTMTVLRYQGCESLWSLEAGSTNITKSCNPQVGCSRLKDDLGLTWFPDLPSAPEEKVQIYDAHGEGTDLLDVEEGSIRRWLWQLLPFSALVFGGLALVRRSKILGVHQQLCTEDSEMDEAPEMS